MKFYIFVLLILSSVTLAGEKPYWIFFKDKGKVDQGRLMKVRRTLSERQIEWRQRFKKGNLVDTLDLPVKSEYVDAVKPFVTKIRRKIKTLNAISAMVSEDKLEEIRSLAFVKEIRPVLKFKRRPVPESGIRKKADNNEDNPFFQLEQIGVDKLHEEGYFGTGMRIGMLDSGFDLDHDAFANMKIVARWDFIHEDSIVKDEDDQDVWYQDGHGTKTLSVIGGYMEGKFMGPAYEAEYVIGKTEDDSDEYQQEEDNLVKGMEWCVENDVTVVSISVGYIDWYTQDQMDGKTPVSSTALDILAQERDVLFVVAAGNEGNSVSTSMIAPSDAEWALSVGSVDRFGYISHFSSAGPTADGRIKPDICARGSSTYTVLQGSENMLTQSNGTSFATPLVAGASALIRQKNPSLNVSTLIKFIRKSGNRADHPDNKYGWGIMNAHIASNQSAYIMGVVQNAKGMRLSNVLITMYALDSFETVYSDNMGSFFFEKPDNTNNVALVFSYDCYEDLRYDIEDIDTVNESILFTMNPLDDDEAVLFPNPAEEYFTIKFKTPITDYSCRIFDVTGNLCFEQKEPNSLYEPVFTYGLKDMRTGDVQGANITKINLVSGVYLVYIKTDKDEYIRKLMVK